MPTKHELRDVYHKQTVRLDDALRLLRKLRARIKSSSLPDAAEIVKMADQMEAKLLLSMEDAAVQQDRLEAQHTITGIVAKQRDNASRKAEMQKHQTTLPLDMLDEERSQDDDGHEQEELNMRRLF